MRAIGAAALVLLATACAEPPAKPELQLAACEVGEQRLDARCGSWQVLEDRAQPQGPRISLRFAVLEALTTERAVDPLFVLVGGPGQAASSSGVPLAQALSALRRTRDVVLVDQRGTGASNPLNCPARDAGLSLELRSDDTLDSEWVQSCRKASKADLAKYTTPHALADLDEVRTALGYERINLWGGSYGSRVALQYAVVYPEHTRSVILDGAAPTDVKLPLYAGRDAQRALERLYADCAAEPACARTFPQGLAQFESLLSELEREPRTVNVPHPSTGARTEVRVTKAGVAAAVRGLLYSTELSRLVPLLVARAKAGDFAPLVTAAATLGDGIAQAGLSLGMFLSVMCSEDVPRISVSELTHSGALR
jgi:pimeloyl-ACP methyl ester carboxylesterase